MEVRPNQRPAVANLVIAMRNHARSILVLILLLLSLASYFLLDTVKRVNFLTKLSETMDTFNYVLQVVAKTFDGLRIAIGSFLNHTVDVWCMFVPGPTCDARQHPKETQTGDDLRKAPLANTREMVGAVEHLSAFLIEIDLARRLHSLVKRTSKSTWNDYLKEELKVEGKEAVDNLESIVQSKDSAVSKARAMMQQFRQQYFSLEKELRRPISWATALLSPSKWDRDDLRPDILNMVKGVARNVDETRKLLERCSHSSKDMKKRALALQDLAESQEEYLLEAKKSFGFMDHFRRRTGHDWSQLDSQIKEWNDIGIFLNSVYDAAVTVSAMTLVKLVRAD
ncbi:hypothetical protein FS837_004483 [Tulasnella sp. UAMH 9824]|nr:hypothetical protein FS837_004483 [Tulasnella sp. UAMH 9824]